MMMSKISMFFSFPPNRLPPVFAVHFADGLAEDVATPCWFGSADVRYVATVVIQHKRAEDVFISWSRRRDGELSKRDAGESPNRRPQAPARADRQPAPDRN